MTIIAIVSYASQSRFVEAGGCDSMPESFYDIYDNII